MEMSTNSVPADRDPRRPLMLHTLASSRRRSLISAGEDGPIRHETAGARALAAEIQAARDAAADSRTTRERVLDTVVDRLLHELNG
jgi:hypothetical protein